MLGPLWLAKQLDRAAIGQGNARDHADRRRLARAIWAKKAEDDAAVDRERYVIDRFLLCVAFCYVVKLENIHRSFYLLVVANLRDGGNSALNP